MNCCVLYHPACRCEKSELTVYDHNMITEHPSTGALHHADWPYRRSFALRYGLAAAVVIIAFLIRHMIYSDLNTRLVFTFFVPAAMIAAWYGGLGAGLFATVLGLLLGGYFFLPHQHAFWLFGARELMALGVYTGTTMLCVLFCENLHANIRRLEHLLAQMRHEQSVKQQLPHQGAPGHDVEGASSLPETMGHGNWLFRRSIFARYGVAIAAVAVAFLIRYWLFGVQDSRVPFILFVPAAMIATWYGGMAPGLLATAAGLMLGDYFFLAAHEGMGPVGEAERLAIGMYAVTTTLCVMLFENLHVHISRLEHALGRARHPHDKPLPDTRADSAYSH
jgi:K+-sensing histidine kinase KdpD